jgi:tripartite ATP-independent transporter DctM subunit
MLALMAIKMWTGLAMALAGFVGILLLRGFTPAWLAMFTGSFNRVATYALTVMPMFILMGAVISETNIGHNMYRSMHLFLGRLRGGLAQATVAATGLFGAITGAQMTGAILMSRIALPSMDEYGYDERLSTGCIAAASPLGILLPPSNALILYGILTEVSIGKLFLAGFVPGVITVVMYFGVISLWCRINPKLAPIASAEKPSLKEKLVSLKHVIPIIIIFLIVMVGIYAGFVTATEAGAIGAFASIVVALVMKELSWKKFMRCLKQTTSLLGMVMLSIMGAFIFSSALSMSGLPAVLSSAIGALPIAPMAIMILIILFYIIFGTVIPEFPMLMMTISIVAPIVVALGFDLVWFGVIMAVVMCFGTVTPPLGLTTLTLAGVSKKQPSVIFRGLVPFLIADAVLVAFMVAFPIIVLWLPNRL